MRLISTAAQCRRLDAQAIARGIPGIALMELASKAVADAVARRFHEAAMAGVLVVCGGGNNGGDGYGAARWLSLAGYPVRLQSTADESAGDAAVMRNAAVLHGLREAEASFRPGLIIDALFGTGLTREVVGWRAELLQRLNGSGVPVVAVDLPSGVHADTGQVLGTALTAEHTVTFGRLKPAFFSAGRAYAGTVECASIGIDPHAETLAQLIDPAALHLPQRAQRAHKKTLGHLAIIAGSAEMAGAAHLACLGALRAGVGVLTLFTPPEALSRLQNLPAEVMVRGMPALAALGEVAGFDAVAVGPGIGGGRPLSGALRLALATLQCSNQPVVADADALFPVDSIGPSVVRTPHPGEAGRLLGCNSQAIEADRFGASARLQGCTVLKGAYSLVGGEQLHVSPFCTPVLATAGSGDVLTGVIGALLARGLPAFDAARTGVWLHGRAGERLQSQRLEGWIASDIAAEIPAAWKELSCS